MEPLHRLIRPEQENALKEVKHLVTAAPILADLDHKLELEVQCDASKNGLGAAVLQQGRPITSPAEL